MSFDISEENKRYALELAEAAHTKIAYVVTDIYQMDMTTYSRYFDEHIYSGDVAYKHFFAEDEQPLFPDVSLRFYTISDIINAVIAAGFQLKRFDEHRGWNGENIPWEFTIIANK